MTANFGYYSTEISRTHEHVGVAPNLYPADYVELNSTNSFFSVSSTLFPSAVASGRSGALMDSAAVLSFWLLCCNYSDFVEIFSLRIEDFS